MLHDEKLFELDNHFQQTISQWGFHSGLIILKASLPLEKEIKF